MSFKNVVKTKEINHLKPTEEKYFSTTNFYPLHNELSRLYIKKKMSKNECDF